MEKEYTDYEEIPSTVEAKERVAKTDVPSVDDFCKVFELLGFTRNDCRFSKTAEHVTGKIVVNGKESVQKETTTLEFLCSSDDLGEVDGDVCYCIRVTLLYGKSKLLEDTVLARPEDIGFWAEMYLKLVDPSQPPF